MSRPLPQWVKDAQKIRKKVLAVADEAYDQILYREAKKIVPSVDVAFEIPSWALKTPCLWKLFNFLHRKELENFRS